MMRLVKKFFLHSRISAVFKPMGQYTSAVYLAQGIAAARSFINARWLGPADYGFWGWLSFIVSFGYHLHLGTQEMMLKEIPSLRARGRLAEADRLVQLNLTFFTLMLSLGAGLMIATAFLLPATTPHLHRWGWGIAGLVMIIEVLFYFEQTVARTMCIFNKISSALLITNMVSLALTCWLVITYGMIGIFVVAIATPLLGWLILHSQTGYQLKFIWAPQEIQKNISLGWPVVAMGLCFLGINWVDRLIIIQFLDTTLYGYYMLGASVAFMIFLFPKGLADVLEPKLHSYQKQNDELHPVHHNFFTPVRLMAWLMPLCLLAGHALLPLILRLFLPDYTPGLLVIRVLIWASYFMGLITMSKSSLVSLGRQHQTIPALLLAIPLNAILSLWMLNLGLGVAGVALGSAFSLFCVSLRFLSLVLQELKIAWPTALRFLAEIYLPFLFLSLPFLGSSWSAQISGHPAVNEWRLIQICGITLFIGSGIGMIKSLLRQYAIHLNTPEVIR